MENKTITFPPNQFTDELLSLRGRLAIRILLTIAKILAPTTMLEEVKNLSNHVAVDLEEAAKLRVETFKKLALPEVDRDAFMRQ